MYLNTILAALLGDSFNSAPVFLCKSSTYPIAFLGEPEYIDLFLDYERESLAGLLIVDAFFDLFALLGDNSMIMETSLNILEYYWWV